MLRGGGGDQLVLRALEVSFVPVWSGGRGGRVVEGEGEGRGRERGEGGRGETGGRTRASLRRATSCERVSCC